MESKKIWGIRAGLVLGLGIAADLAAVDLPRPPEVTIQRRAFADLSHQELTPAGEKVLEMNPDEWLHAETEHFVIHGTDDSLIVKASYEAEFSYAQCHLYFGEDPAPEKAHVFIIGDDRVWQMLLEEGNWLRISLALHLINDIFVLRDGKDPFTYIKIPHEVVHLRVRRAFGGDCPFWAEEGSAEQLGWRIANRYNQMRYGRELVRTIPPVAEDKLLSWNQLVQFTGYPDDPEEALCLERQTQRMVKELLDHVGEENVTMFLQTFLRDKTELAVGMEQVFDTPPEDLAALEAKSRETILVEETE